MKHHHNKSLEQKIQLTKELEITPDNFNRLFFTARNGAIASLLRNIEHYLQDQNNKLVVRANWKESSFNSVHIELTLHEKENKHTRTINLKREKINTKNHDISDLVYTFDRLSPETCYYPKKPRQLGIDFDAVLDSPEFVEFLKQEVNGVNFPFNYESYSSF